MHHVLYKLFLVITILFSVSGCKTINTHGQLVTDNDIAKIKAKIFTKSEIQEMLGSPTYVPEYSANTWYYIQQSTTSGPFRKTTISDQRVVEIHFIDEKVHDIFVAINSKPRQLNIATHATTSEHIKMGKMNKFVKNIGRFNPNKKIKKKKSY